MSAGVTVRKLDAVWAFYDRYIFFKESNRVEISKYVLRNTYGILLLCIKELDLRKYNDEIKVIMLKVIKALGLDLRVVKLLLVYHIRWCQHYINDIMKGK